MLAAGLLHLRRIPGVMRPAIAVPIPTRSGHPFVLLDSGANADGRPEHLLQFAHMGAIFAEDILEITRPEVRLLSIGEEPEKGNQLTLEAYGLLETSAVGFAGNAESRDLLEGAGDVIVCDGFTGNVVLKLLEGTIKTILDALREEVLATPRGKVGAFLIRPAARRLRTKFDPDTYGGAYLLGLRGLSVIAHGNSSRTAIANAIRLAARGVEHDVVGRLASRLPDPEQEQGKAPLLRELRRAGRSRLPLYDRALFSPNQRKARSIWQRRVKKSSSGSRKSSRSNSGSTKQRSPRRHRFRRIWTPTRSTSSS